jgi:hypothetical protein
LGAAALAKVVSTDGSGQPVNVPPQFLRTLSTVSISALPIEAKRARELTRVGVVDGGQQDANQHKGNLPQSTAPSGTADAPPSDLPSAWARNLESSIGHESSDDGHTSPLNSYSKTSFA